MFQPNSIRSLLKKRNVSRLNLQSQNECKDNKQFSKTFTNFNQMSKNNDPDLQSILQAKLMIKQIDHQVDSIRTWRQHQKQLLKQKLKSNQQIYTIANEQYENFQNELQKVQQFQNQKLIQKMKIQQNKLKRINMNNSNVFFGDTSNQNAQTLQSSQAGQIIYQDWQTNNLQYNTQLISSIAEAQQKINQKKHMKSITGQNIQDKHIAFLNSISELSSSDIFQKNKQLTSDNYNQQSSNKALDKDMLRKQLQDIDKQLQEMQDLLKD